MYICMCTHMYIYIYTHARTRTIPVGSQHPENFLAHVMKEDFC